MVTLSKVDGGDFEVFLADSNNVMVASGSPGVLQVALPFGSYIPKETDTLKLVVQDHADHSGDVIPVMIGVRPR
jgi:hypothetical protein